MPNSADGPQGKKGKGVHRKGEYTQGTGTFRERLTSILRKRKGGKRGEGGIFVAWGWPREGLS